MSYENQPYILGKSNFKMFFRQSVNIWNSQSTHKEHSESISQPMNIQSSRRYHEERFKNERSKWRISLWRQSQQDLCKRSYRNTCVKIHEE